MEAFKGFSNLFSSGLKTENSASTPPERGLERDFIGDFYMDYYGDTG